MLNKRIKALRNQKNITQKDLAISLGLTPKMISFYELGERVPPPDMLSKLADIFNVSTDYLLCRTSLIQCSICHNSYNPLDDMSTKEHDDFHSRFIKIRNQFGDILSYDDADKKRNNAIIDFRNPTLDEEQRISAYDDYLKYSFMMSLWRKGFHSKHNAFDEFAKNEIQNLQPDALISETLCNAIRKKYSVSENAPKIISFQTQLTKHETFLVKEYRKLNPIGKNKLISTAKEMNCSPLYNDNYQAELAAAHHRTDVTYSAEETQEDYDMMSDENF